jgi:hypothetical protein
MATGANPWLIIFLIIAFIAIIGNFIAICYLFRLGSLNAVTTKLILFLHISALIHSLGQMPLLYYRDEGLCEAMGFVHFYGGLVNAVALVLLSTTYLNFTVGNPEKNLFITKYCTFLTFGFALITLLPLITNSYDASGVWCTLPVRNQTSNIWSIFVSYIWVFFALIYASCAMGYVGYHCYIDGSIFSTIFSVAGVYIILTWAGLIPGLVPRIMGFFMTIDLTFATQFFLRVPSNLASIGYCLCLIYNYSTFTEYEIYFTSHPSRDNISYAELERAFNSNRLSRGTATEDKLSSRRFSTVSEQSPVTKEDNNKNDRAERISRYSSQSSTTVSSINDTSTDRRLSSTNAVKNYLSQLRKSIQSNPRNSLEEVDSQSPSSRGQSPRSSGGAAELRGSDIENPLISTSPQPKGILRRTLGSSMELGSKE